MLVLVFLMARGGPGGKRRRSSAQQQVEPPQEDAGSEYNPGEDSDRESLEEDLEAAVTEIRSKKKEDKGKEKAAGTSKGKGKGKGKEKVAGTGGISINESGDQDVPVDSRRRSIYSSKTCIGERMVGVANLFEKVPGFQEPFENGDLHEVCAFTERTGYGLELVREFYMRAGNLLESDDGPHMFSTSVRGVPMSITPATIGLVLGMEVRTDGVDYLNAGFDSVRDWTRMLKFLCVPDAENNGNAILSKDLKPEYRFLNFVICYNVMPLANTKIIRWDRVLYLYLLGHPNIVKERNINLNVPFLIWKRMAREMKTASKKDRIPFPLLIMRILRLHEVNVDCSSYEHSLREIGEVTMSKSHAQLHPEARASAPASAHAPSPPPVDQDMASLSSVYSEQQRLSGELARQGAVQAELQQDIASLKKQNRSITRYLRLLCEKMGCGSSEMPPPDTDSE